MTEHNCPACGQRVLIRHGVKLSPKLCDIFDVIDRATKRGGIDAESLAWILYPTVSRSDAKRCIAVSVNHINDKLVETDYRIQMDGRQGRYRVHKQ
jgi:hypothetical protein